MKRGALSAVALCAALLAPAIARAQLVPAQFVPAMPQAALVHHPVSTGSADAQRSFDEGLTLIYAFNREEARKRFERAAKADPKLAMAYWGVALAVGPNINEEMTADDLQVARAALARAVALEPGALPAERRYIEALLLRYPKDDKAAPKASYVAYRDAMQKLFADYPLDDDAAALSVESAMDVEGFGWNGETPIGNTAALVATLEAVLRRNPDHVGANHYLVHLLDAPVVAERAEASARRLSELPVEPAASHLVHMAGHTDLDLGLFTPLLREARESVALGQAYAVSQKIVASDVPYFRHNLDFYIGAALLLDDKDQIAASLAIAKTQSPGAAFLMLARLGRWDEILAAPKPAAGHGQLSWHYSRVLAFAARKDPVAAQAELDALQATIKESGGGEYFIPIQRMAQAQVAAARGDSAAAVEALHGAMTQMAYYPPEVFSPAFYPAGEWLGWLLLESGDNAGAEAAFRADLVRTPHNARTLDGLMRALVRQGRAAEARQFADELASNWRGPLDDLHAAEI